MTIDELKAEVMELTEKVNDCENDLIESEWFISRLQKQIESYVMEISVLNDEIEEIPCLKGFLDKEKYDLFLLNFDKFSLTDFESFINKYDTSRL